MGKSKKKKKPKKEYSSSSSESSDNWVEKESSKGTFQDNWMQQDFLAGIKTVSSKDIRDEKESQRIADTKKKSKSLDELGQHSKELNPYWKSGNQGLPPEQKQASVFIPDAQWLQRSLKRMREQSEDSGRGLREIAAERYGSWNAFQDLMDAAEKKEMSNRHSDKVSERQSRSVRQLSKSRFLKPGDSEERSSSRKRFLKPDNSVSKMSFSYKSSETPSWKKSKNVEKSEKVNESQTSPLEKNNKPPESETSSIPSSEKPAIKGKILTSQEKNIIAAKIIKAELVGNEKLINKLKKKLQMSDELEACGNQVYEDNNRSNQESDEDETVVLTRTTKTGQSWPVTQSDMPLGTTSKRRKNKKVLVRDKDGERERYFADDDQYSLKELVELEKTGAAEDQTQVMSRLSSKMLKGTDGENYTLDDAFETESARVYSQQQKDERHKHRAIDQHKKLQRRLENCRHCFGNSENPKHLLIAVGEVSYIKLPSHKPLQSGHCIIAPMHHCVTATALDENVWSEMRKFMLSLRNMFLKEDDDCVFIQTCINLKNSNHFYMECIPLPKELGDDAPIYFYKAIQECEGEWSQNRKLVDTRGKSVRDKIPTGLPYFAVDFGMDGGYAHIVENEHKFPPYFGREILGGMLDADPQLWRKPREEHFSDQTKRTIEFENKYKDFNWTNSVT